MTDKQVLIWWICMICMLPYMFMWRCQLRKFHQLFAIVEHIHSHFHAANPFCNIWYLHFCDAFAPQPATLDTYAFDMLNQSRSWKGKLPDVDRSLSFEMSCFFISSWLLVYLFGIISFHRKFLQNINVLRSDCHRLIQEFCKYFQQLRNIWLFE